MESRIDQSERRERGAGEEARPGKRASLKDRAEDLIAHKSQRDVGERAKERSFRGTRHFPPRRASGPLSSGVCLSDETCVFFFASRHAGQTREEALARRSLWEGAAGRTRAPGIKARTKGPVGPWEGPRGKRVRRRWGGPAPAAPCKAPLGIARSCRDPRNAEGGRARGGNRRSKGKVRKGDGPTLHHRDGKGVGGRRSKSPIARERPQAPARTSVGNGWKSMLKQQREKESKQITRKTTRRGKLLLRSERRWPERWPVCVARRTRPRASACSFPDAASAQTVSRRRWQA